MSDYLTEDQALDWFANRGLPICKSTLRAERKHIRHVRIRRRVFYPVVGLEAYLEAKECPATISRSEKDQQTGMSAGPTPKLDALAVRQRVQRTMKKLASSSPTGRSTPSITVVK